MGSRGNLAESSETVWNFALVGRGTERLFAALKAYIEKQGGKVKYQRLSGYEFHVEEVRPENRPPKLGEMPV